MLLKLVFILTIVNMLQFVSSENKVELLANTTNTTKNALNTNVNTTEIGHIVKEKTLIRKIKPTENDDKNITMRLANATKEVKVAAEQKQKISEVPTMKKVQMLAENVLSTEVLKNSMKNLTNNIDEKKTNDTKQIAPSLPANITNADSHTNLTNKNVLDLKNQTKSLPIASNTTGTSTIIKLINATAIPSTAIPKQNNTISITNATNTNTSISIEKVPLKRKKPLITLSVEDLPKLNIEHSSDGASKQQSSSKVTEPETEPILENPEAQPSQEQQPYYRKTTGAYYIVPIVTIIFTVPIAIVVSILLYRRFRDLWSTRHYRRMDFLVDGMYND